MAKKRKKSKWLKEIKKMKKSFTLFEVVIIIFITTLLAIVIGYLVADNFPVKQQDNKCYSDFCLQENYKDFFEAFAILKKDYYLDVSEEELIDAAIDGMFDSLDPHTSYIHKEELDSFTERLVGDYQGIGAEIMSDGDYVIIINPFDNTPASDAELIFGDKISKVDGIDAKGMTAREVSNLIKGPEGTSVTLEIIRNENDFEVTLTRAKIEIPSVHTKVYGDVGYIGIDIFSAVTYTQFKDGIIDLERQGIKSLVIDVRGNSGGYLGVVTDMVSMFLDLDKIIYKMQLKDDIVTYYSKTGNKRTYDVAILIDAGSASASEILATSLKESYGATIIGTISVGKGTVQETHYLDNGGMIKFTTKKWLTPNGNWVNDTEGIIPDIEVIMSDRYYNDPSEENDNQLQRAIKLLKE